MAIYQITALFLLFGLTSGFTNKKTSKSFSIFLAALFSFLTTLQILSYYTTGRPLNYQVFTHMQPDSVAMAFDLFGPQVLLLVVLFLVFALVYFFSDRLLSLLFTGSSGAARRISVFILFCLCLFSLVLPQDGILRQAYYLTRNLTPSGNGQDLASLLNTYGVRDYVPRENISGAPGKNVIIISLESFERGFLNTDAFPDVAPNLRRMSESWTFFPNFTQSKGAEWTSGALYGMLTGMPAYFGIHGNNIFQTTTGTRLAGLGDVFHTAGYDMTWFMSKPAHAGNAQLLSHYHFKIFHDSDHSIANFEMSDANLFDHAKKSIATLAKSNKPFVIGISTMSTHHPDGIADENFLSMKKPEDSGIEYMARVTDYLVKDFCDFVLNHDALGDTVIFILPDHLAMPGNSALEKLKATGDRSLYLLTNAPKTVFEKKSADPICTFDLPRLILEGAQIDSNIRFLTESLDPEKLSQRDFTDLNLRLWTRYNIKNGLTINFSPRGDILVSAGGKMRFQGKAYLEITESGDLVVHNGRTTSNLLLTLNQSGNSVCMGTQGRMFSCFRGQETYTFTNQEIAFAQQIHSHGITEDRLSYPGHITIGSSGSQSTPSYVIFDDFRVNFQHPGVMLIFRDRLKTSAFSGLTPETQPGDLLNAIQAGIDTGALLAVVAHGDVTHIVAPIQDELQALDLSILARLPAGQPYIALHARGGVFSEYSSDRASLMLRLPRTTALKPEAGNHFTPVPASDPSRYIAHAGGAIRGKTYTNALEAMDSAYQAGYRLFELDIITTSDKQLVAAHDWDHWADITGYDGPLPPTHEAFMEQRIHDEFTPLDMAAINRWFSDHPDATLVTDKINRPVDFAKNFIDKKRLMMELFSEQALKEALEAGIAMPVCNIRVLYNHYTTSYDLSSFIHQYNIRAVALPVSFMESHPLIVRYLFENDVRLYAYTSNDADFIRRHVGTTIYGVYTDTWPLSAIAGTPPAGASIPEER